MEAWEIAALFGVTFVAAFIHAVSGFGFALFIIPPLSFLIGPVEAVILSTLMGTFTNFRVFVGSYQDTDWKLSLPLMVGAAIGMPFGLIALYALDPATMKVIIAVVVLISTVLIWRGWRIHRYSQWISGGVGVVSGVLNTSTSMNGPPVVLYLQGINVEPARFRGTIAAFFSASNLIALALLLGSGRVKSESFVQLAITFPALLAGYPVGNRVFKRIDPERFRLVVIGILLLSAVIAFVTAIASH